MRNDADLDCAIICERRLALLDARAPENRVSHLRCSA